MLTWRWNNLVVWPTVAKCSKSAKPHRSWIRLLTYLLAAHAELGTLCMHLTLLSGRSCISSSFTHIIGEKFWQWAQRTTAGDRSLVGRFPKLCCKASVPQHRALHRSGVLYSRVLSSAITTMLGRWKPARNTRTRPPAKIFHQCLVWYYSSSSNRPYVLPARLTGPVYRDFLEQSFAEGCTSCTTGLQLISACTHEKTWTMFYLRGGPFFWPARSPDLNPLDFFVWGHLRCLVYETPVGARRWSAQDPGSMWQLMAETWYFRTSATVNGASLRVVQWSRWSSLWTAAIVVAVFMLKCLIIMLCQCYLRTIKISSINYVRYLQSHSETSLLPLKKYPPLIT
jgi:hypothetical protein